MNNVSSLMDKRATSDVSGMVIQAIGYPMRCSRAIHGYFSPLLSGGNRPEKSIKNVSNKPISGMTNAVQYFGMGLNFWQLS